MKEKPASSVLTKNGKTNSKNRSGLTIHHPLAPAKVTEVYDSYWRFAAIRQEVFFSRIQGALYPWTSDPVVNKYRFTNAYRASDRVSQYLIRHVIYNNNFPSSNKEILFRVLLFKLFNKIETWELLILNVGRPTLKDYSFERYDRALSKAMSEGKRIYSAAYIMASCKSRFGLERKHSNHLKLIEHILKEGTHNKLADSKTMQQAFEILKGFPGLGNFLAYQLLIDINYSPIIDFPESDFVVPGPGANGGISKCFISQAGLSNSEIIKFVTDRQEYEFKRLGLSFKTLWGRPLQLIDCQNLFCEVDKYARVKHPTIKGDSDRVKIKQSLKINPKPLSLWFPPKWDLNSKIPNSLSEK